MARRNSSSPSTRRDRASRGGSTAAAAANQTGRFGGSAASRSRAEDQQRIPGAARTSFASQNAEQRARVERRAREPQWQKETQSTQVPGPMAWRSASELVDSPGTRRAPKAEDKPGPSGRRGTQGQGGWATSTPREGDPDYEHHTASPARSRRRLGSRLRGDDTPRDRGRTGEDDTVMGSSVGRRGAAGSQDERPAPSNRRSQTTRKFDRD